MKTALQNPEASPVRSTDRTALVPTSRLDTTPLGEQTRQKRCSVKKLLAFGLALFLFSQIVVAGQVWVNGYFKKDCTYVAWYYRTTPDDTIFNNWSTYPNVNPYTGKV